MQPQVRYLKSSDGARLAVSMLGEGRPLVIVPSALGTISIEGFWEIPEIRQNLERLAEKRKLILYDVRGWGSRRETSTIFLSLRLSRIWRLSLTVSTSRPWI